VICAFFFINSCSHFSFLTFFRCQVLAVRGSRLQRGVNGAKFAGGSSAVFVSVCVCVSCSDLKGDSSFFTFIRVVAFKYLLRGSQPLVDGVKFYWKCRFRCESTPLLTGRMRWISRGIWLSRPSGSSDTARES
jgi:hypothetical protein